ncbi:hypothetical protein IE53DRAFT_391296 [Violaceomyces palustris]|uniref:Uncharacterized protein n=1 Tax=Violaceomyces palustris TaxID=1673888 RepID=A0ACD0NL35_9BASI|nr:hypothetical protein IE53DRAFT_391296 [Violaceomyces palustris]
MNSPLPPTPSPEAGKDYLHLVTEVDIASFCKGSKPPLLILLCPIDEASKGFCKNLNEEGYDVLLVDSGSKWLTCESSIMDLTNPEAHSCDLDMRGSKGWRMSIHLVHLVSQVLKIDLSRSANRNVAMINVGLDEEESDVSTAFNAECGGRLVKAVIHYGPQIVPKPPTDEGDEDKRPVLQIPSFRQEEEEEEEEEEGPTSSSSSKPHANGHAKGLSPPPTLIHLSSQQEELYSAFLRNVDEGIVSASGIPFHPLTVSKLEASVGEARPKPFDLHMYPDVSATRPWSWCFHLAFSTNTHRTAFGEGVKAEERSAAGMAYTRTLRLLKQTVGPRFSIEQYWDQHCYLEFAERDPSKTMETMVAQPHVNHVATMTGGAGKDQVTKFYTHHFVDCSPPDSKLINVSRTVGTDRIVDEMIFTCTHTTEIEYFLPGVPPTGKRIEIPMVGIINFRGSKLAFESLYWDQSNVLVQLGLLDPEKSSLGKDSQGRRIRLPIAGQEVSQKVLDPLGRPSNQLMGEKWEATLAGGK